MHERREITTKLVEIEEPLKAKRQIEDMKESKRIEGIQAKINAIKAKVPTVPMSSSELDDILFDLDITDITESEFHEFTAEAEKVKAEATGRVGQMVSDRKKWEAEEKARKEDAERLEQQRKEQQAKEIELAHAEALIEDRERTLEIEKARLEKEKRAEDERKERERQEAERIKAEEMEGDARKQSEAEIVPDQVIIETIERIAVDVAEASEIREDKEKLIAFANLIKSIPSPTVCSDKALRITEYTKIKLIEVVEYIFERSEDL